MKEKDKGTKTEMEMEGRIPLKRNNNNKFIRKNRILKILKMNLIRKLNL